MYAVRELKVECVSSMSSRIDLFHFQAGGSRRWPNLALVFCVLILCCSIFYYLCMFAFIVFILVFFSTKPRDWLGRTSLIWPILCQVGRKTLTQSVTPSVCGSATVTNTRTFVLTTACWFSLMTCHALPCYSSQVCCWWDRQLCMVEVFCCLPLDQ